MPFSEQTAIKIRNRMIFIKLKSFFDRLHHLQYALIKGEALSIQAYGEVGKRNYSDIDILVNLKDVSELEKILREEGFTNYRQDYVYESRKKRILNILYSHQIAPYFKRIGLNNNIEIDINFDLYWGSFDGEKNDVILLLNNIINCEIYGCDVKILSPLEATLQLILHNYKDLNSVFHLINKGSIQAYLYWDIYYLIKRNHIKKEELYLLCEKWHALPYAYYMFYYIYQLSRDMKIYEFLQVFDCSEGKMLLECYGLNKRSRKKWKVGFYERLENKEIIKDLIKDMNTEELKQLKEEYKYY